MKIPKINMCLLFSFIGGVLSKVTAGVTGGLVAAIVLVYEHAANKQISLNVLWVWLGSYFVIGSFMSWKETRQRLIDSRNKRKVLVRQIGRLENEIAKHPEIKPIIMELFGYIQRGEWLESRIKGSIIFADNDWRNIKKWHAETIDYLQGNVGPIAADMFTKEDDVYAWTNREGKVTNNAKSVLKTKIKALRDIANNPFEFVTRWD